MSSPLDLGREVSAALEAADLAADLVRREYRTFAAIPDAPVSISTHVDKASQDLILGYLHDLFPNDALCAEESTAGLAKATHRGRRVWVVDPIDGTRGFAKKTGQFSVMIGLLVDGEPAVGVVAEPAQERTTYAWVGGGCWYLVADGTSVRCHVSRRPLRDAVLTQSWSKPGQPSRPVRALAPAGVVETYSGGVKLAQVARGDADVYANVYETFFDWDICAGHVLVTEAGGRVTDLGGEPIRYAADRFAQTRGLLATNGVFHDDAVRALAAVPA